MTLQEFHDFSDAHGNHCHRITLHLQEGGRLDLPKGAVMTQGGVIVALADFFELQINPRLVKSVEIMGAN